MPITRKPNQSTADPNKAAVDVDALINRGGSVATAPQVEENLPLPNPARATATINLRIPLHIVEKIDKSLKTRRVKTPRHTWLMEAVIEKLERESEES